MAKEQKKPFVLRLNPEMMAALEKWSADEFRSLNGQIEYLLSEALKKNQRFNKTDQDL
jgi:hypothetical protein